MAHGTPLERGFNPQKGSHKVARKTLFSSDDTSEFLPRQSPSEKLTQFKCSGEVKTKTKHHVFLSMRSYCVIIILSVQNPITISVHLEPLLRDFQQRKNKKRSQKIADQGDGKRRLGTLQFDMRCETSLSTTRLVAPAPSESKQNQDCAAKLYHTFFTNTSRRNFTLPEEKCQSKGLCWTCSIA